MGLLARLQGAAFAALLAVASLSAHAQSGSLTTTFAHNNTFAGNVFDLTPSQDLTVTAFDVNVGAFGTDGGGAGESVQINIYWRPGTGNGFQNSSAGWTLLGSATVTSQGANRPTRVPIGGLSLSAGQTYGIYVDLVNFDGNGRSLLYTDGNTPYSNADLALTPLFGKGTPAFASGTFSPRIWNGTVYYTRSASCAGSGYTGTQLEWCKNICERGYNGATLEMWIRRWLNRWRELPYCARPDGGGGGGGEGSVRD